MSDQLTVNQLIAALQKRAELNPEIADRPIEIVRHNGKRTEKKHALQWVGLASTDTGTSRETICSIMLDWAGE